MTEPPSPQWIEACLMWVGKSFHMYSEEEIKQHKKKYFVN